MKKGGLDCVAGQKHARVKHNKIQKQILKVNHKNIFFFLD